MWTPCLLWEGSLGRGFALQNVVFGITPHNSHYSKSQTWYFYQFKNVKNEKAGQLAALHSTLSHQHIICFKCVDTFKSWGQRLIYHFLFELNVSSSFGARLCGCSVPNNSCCLCSLTCIVYQLVTNIGWERERGEGKTVWWDNQVLSPVRRTLDCRSGEPPILLGRRAELAGDGRRCQSDWCTALQLRCLQPAAQPRSSVTQHRNLNLIIQHSAGYFNYFWVGSRDCTTCLIPSSFINPWIYKCWNRSFLFGLTVHNLSPTFALNSYIGQTNHDL